MENDSTFGFLEEFDKAQSNVSRWPEWAKRSMVMASTFYKGTPSKSEVRQTAKKRQENNSVAVGKRSAAKVAG